MGVEYYLMSILGGPEDTSVHNIVYIDQSQICVLAIYFRGELFMASEDNGNVSKVHISVFTPGTA